MYDIFNLFVFFCRPVAKNTDKFIMKHIPDENREVIESDWDKFLGLKEGDK